MAGVVRSPAVAGRFYPKNAKALERDVRKYLSEGGERMRALASIVPHAGYIYSGHVAGAVYSRLELTSRVLLLGPNHTGMGTPLAIMSEGHWTTPLGEVEIDSRLAGELKQSCELLTEDFLAHRYEHALEVQLPFLQTVAPGSAFVPLTVGVGHLNTLRELGEAIAAVLMRWNEPVMIVVSSDMNHYESDAVTRIKDKKAIDRILALDPAGLHEVVINEPVTMCGYAPAVAMLFAAEVLGAKSGQLVRYATSAEVSRDYDSVVGYAGIVIA